jgi:predicted nucleic acid-binding protein
MAASPVLVDSSYYIHCLRERRDPLRVLALTAAARDLAVCPIIRCEVSRGLRRPEVRVKLTSAWDVMLNVPTDQRMWAQAEQTLWELDRKGMVVPLTDVVIATCARRIGAVVLTRDKQFYEIPGISVLEDLPI